MDSPHYLLNTWTCFQVKTFQTTPQLDNYQITLQGTFKIWELHLERKQEKKKNESYKREDKSVDGLTTLFLYHFCAKKSRALCDALKYRSFAAEENRALHFFWLIQYGKTYGWDLSWPNLRWRILISKSHGRNWCQFKRLWTKLIHSLKIRGQIYNLPLYLSNH